MTHPLLSSQMGIYAGWAAHPQTTGYNLPSVVPFPCTIDAERLAAAMQRIADTREVLHTRIRTDTDGQPRQYADMQMPIPVRLLRMSEAEARQLIDHDFVRPFAIDGSEPLARFAVIQTPRFHYLLMDLHHVIADGLTIVHSLLGIDLPRAYQGMPLLPVAGSLYQMADEEQARCQNDDYLRAAEYQRVRFRDVTFARLSAESSDAWGATLRRSAFLDRKGVDEWCAAYGLTPNLLWLGAFGLVMSRWCRQKRIAFTVINHGRRGRQYADAYGMFVRSAPVMADIREGTVIDYIRSMRGELNSTVRYAVYPYTHFCRDMEVTPDVAFGFQASVQEMVTLDGCSVQGCQLPPPMTRNDLSCMVYLTDCQYEVRMESSEALNSAFVLQTLADTVVWTAENMMARPDSQLADIALVSEAEGQRILALSEGERMDDDENDTFLRLFLRQAALTPDATAVTDVSGSLTYRELAEQTSEQAAQWVRQGYGEGDIIPVKAEQTKEFLVAAIAAWRIGAGYSVPLPSSEAPLLSSEGDDNRLTRGATSPLGDKRGALAYVMYTSGSTGEPKGVMVSQRALTHFIHVIVNQWRLTAQCRIACHASVAFDASVEDLFPVLTTGGQLFIVPEPIRRDPDRLYRYLIDNGITGGCMATQWGVMMTGRYDLPLDYLCLGGERLMTVPQCRGRVINTYGPTEMTVDATYYEFEPGRHYDTIPIGRPLPGLAAYVVDAEGHLLPQGATGELWLAGPQMAEGYWNDPMLTAEKFTACRFAAGRVYHTGDLTRWNADGQLEFMGRIDRQVKLRGYRIEPGQVEQAVMRVEGVQQAAVVVRQIAGQDHLCAYYSAGRVITPHEMTMSLESLLPPYMVPTAYQQMDVLPLTAHDKVDTERLPDIDIIAAAKEYVAPSSDLERRWCDIFARVLGVGRVGVTDDFFTLGGTSLTAIHLLTAAAEQGLHLTYDQIFEHPTVQGIVEIEARGKKQEARGKKQEARSKKQEARSKKQEVRGKKQEVRGKKQEMRSKKQEVRSTSQRSTYLTGATGFLGIHVLRELLERGHKVVCLVRGANDNEARKRLNDAWQWYHGSPLPPHLVSVLAADITDPLLVSMSLPCEGTGTGILIHCAADVRQYATGGQLFNVNVEGTRNVVRLCSRLQLLMIHISTISIGQAGVADTPYIRSKAAAEEVVGDAVRKGLLDARILRVGNLTARRSDGTPQRNAEENAFAVMTGALLSLGCYPVSLAEVVIDRSPVDESARAVVDMLCCDSSALVTDVSNPEKSTLGDIARQWGLEPVGTAEWEHRVKAARLTDRQRLMLACGMKALPT